MWAAMVLPRLAVGDPHGAERDLERARAAWSAPGFTLQELSLIQGHYHIGHYRGDVRAVWDRVEDGWRRLARSPLQRGSALGSTLRGLRAGTAGAMAAQTGSRAERKALLAHVREGAAALRRTARASWTSRLAEPLDALADLLSGREQAGFARLRAAVTMFTEVPLLREVCRRQLGVRLGGDEGRVHVAQADAYFRNHGVTDAARFATAVMPGFAES
jgi:hypothetical protein